MGVENNFRRRRTRSFSAVEEAELDGQSGGSVCLRTVDSLEFER